VALNVAIRPVEHDDADEWIRMRQALWPDDPASHARDVAAFFEGTIRNLDHVLLAVDGENHPIGFAEMSIRSYSEGCYSGRVAFLEGWYVDAAFRRRGVGAALVRGVEAWGRAQRSTELGSDTQLHNTDGSRAHLALGFDEVERIICFRKPL
jgi:aminoglycoside 6'-N-acetyltransferase I